MSPIDQPKTPSSVFFSPGSSRDYFESKFAIPIALLAAILSMMGGSITLTREDLNPWDTTSMNGKYPEITLYEVTEPYRVVIKLKEANDETSL